MSVAALRGLAGSQCAGALAPCATCARCKAHLTLRIPCLLPNTSNTQHPQKELHFGELYAGMGTMSVAARQVRRESSMRESSMQGLPIPCCCLLACAASTQLDWDLTSIAPTDQHTLLQRSQPPAVLLPHLLWRGGLQGAGRLLQAQHQPPQLQPAACRRRAAPPLRPGAENGECVLGVGSCFIRCSARIWRSLDVDLLVSLLLPHTGCRFRPIMCAHLPPTHI